MFEGGSYNYQSSSLDNIMFEGSSYNYQSYSLDNIMFEGGSYNYYQSFSLDYDFIIWE